MVTSSASARVTTGPISFLLARVKNFAGYDGTSTWLWPRWLVLRAVGLVYMIIFSGILQEYPALIGPEGLAPLPDLMATLRDTYPNLAAAIWQAPTLFWFSTHPVMPGMLAWTGLAAAIALTLNFWPRLTLFTCWLMLVSFARGWLVFSDPQVDWLMLEVALLCIPFAPAGYRPGLGATSSPRPIAVFMVRWLLFRVMFETGLAKLLSGEVRWFDFTAMDVLYETAPCPTILGYFAHQMPHAWHVGEIALTFAAELLAPLLALFGGRRGRWIALALWSALQIGIQLTCNFGWLNTASLALGLLLLDDQMLISAIRRLRWSRLVEAMRTQVARVTAPASLAPWRRRGLGVVLWTHFAVTIIAFWTATTLPIHPAVERVIHPVKQSFTSIGAANAFMLYSRLDPFHFVAEFVGSNDGGVTWRPYEFRYFPQALDRMPPFIAPRFPRFEATLQIQAATRDTATRLYASVATRLLEGNPDVIKLFARNPFPDRPPQLIRTPGWHYTFTDYATYRDHGRFWHREYLGEYQPMLYLAPDGRVARVGSELEQLTALALHDNAAAQAELGFRYLSGDAEVTRDPTAAAHWLTRAAEQGMAEAQLNLALMHRHGDGVPRDPAQALDWCERAARLGLAAAQDQLGIMLLSGEARPRDEIEALAWFIIAAKQGHAPAIEHRDTAITHMSPAAVLAGQQRAKAINERIGASTPKD